MQEIGAQAVLESAPNMGEGLTTSLPRREVEDALAIGDAPLELVLDLTRFADGEPTETRKVAVAWERADLERVLQESEGDRVDFTFDRDALWRTMEEDVEAHGFRETVIVLAVAVTAASGAAANASAEPGAYFGAGGPPIVANVAPDDRAVPRATPTAQPSVGVDDRAVSRAIPTPEPTTGVDDRAVSRAIPTPEPTTGVDDRAVSRAIPTPEPTTGVDDRAVSRAIPTPEPTTGVDDRAVSRAIPTPEPTTGVDDRAVSRAIPTPEIGVDDRAVSRAVTPVGAEPTAAADAGSWAPSPSDVAAIGGAIALAITGAAFFVAGRRQRPETRPA
jgi:hypothetical protein